MSVAELWFAEAGKKRTDTKNALEEIQQSTCMTVENVMTPNYPAPCPTPEYLRFNRRVVSREWMEMPKDSAGVFVSLIGSWPALCCLWVYRRRHDDESSVRGVNGQHVKLYSPSPQKWQRQGQHRSHESRDLIRFLSVLLSSSWSSSCGSDTYSQEGSCRINN